MAQKPMLRAEVYAHAMRASQNRKKEVRCEKEVKYFRPSLRHTFARADGGWMWGPFSRLLGVSWWRRLLISADSASASLLVTYKQI